MLCIGMCRMDDGSALFHVQIGDPRDAMFSGGCSRCRVKKYCTGTVKQHHLATDD